MKETKRKDVRKRTYSYMELKQKAELCRWHAYCLEFGSWARSYWLMVAGELEVRAANLPLCNAGFCYE